MAQITQRQIKKLRELCIKLKEKATLKRLRGKLIDKEEAGKIIANLLKNQQHTTSQIGQGKE
jgi:predicted component of type VI protein secretion system